MSPGLKHVLIVGGALAVLGGALVWRLTRPEAGVDPARSTAAAPTPTPPPTAPPTAPTPVTKGGHEKVDPKPDPVQARLEEEGQYLTGDTKAAVTAREVRTAMARPASMRTFIHSRDFGRICSYFSSNLDETLPLLKKMATEDPVGAPRAWALSILAPLKRPELETLFIDRVSRDEWPGAVLNAAQGLVNLGSTAGMEAIRARLDKEPKEEIRNGLRPLVQ